MPEGHPGSGLSEDFQPTSHGVRRVLGAFGLVILGLAIFVWSVVLPVLGVLYLVRALS